MKTIAYAISFLFHPLFVVTYMAILISLINPYLFGKNDIQDNAIFILQIFFSTLFLPLIGVLMMKLLGFINTLEMEDRKERIGPLMVCISLYSWMSYNFYNDSSIPNGFTIFMVGSTMALCLAFFINVFSKISLHALGMGGLLGMVVITMMFFSYGSFQFGIATINMNFLLMVMILLSGLVGTARLILEAHQPMDLYGGYFIGFGTQFLAFSILT